MVSLIKLYYCGTRDAAALIAKTTTGTIVNFLSFKLAVKEIEIANNYIK